MWSETGGLSREVIRIPRDRPTPRSAASFLSASSGTSDRCSRTPAPTSKRTCSRWGSPPAKSGTGARSPLCGKRLSPQNRVVFRGVCSSSVALQGCLQPLSPLWTVTALPSAANFLKWFEYLSLRQRQKECEWWWHVWRPRRQSRTFQPECPLLHRVTFVLIVSSTARVSSQ